MIRELRPDVFGVLDVTNTALTYGGAVVRSRSAWRSEIRESALMPHQGSCASKRFDTWTNPIPDYDEVRAETLVRRRKRRRRCSWGEWPLYLVLPGENAEKGRNPRSESELTFAFGLEEVKRRIMNLVSALHFFLICEDLMDDCSLASL
ncbi:uncharacterized protein EDB93DRAFT_1103020 [Suillus bovinus]|uniref:uncharacterized protein n=1 Tax=Suillus bovinus TaxID=48563 RepID=UPI001B87B9C3|nr:uncharacterized protein EDB93DRAFT_1103020 [Suillus bovinus]KAG2151571.1 hypothetical protein EDB93DRAFT_1103020 [Suillus bovinus]